MISANLRSWTRGSGSSNNSGFGRLRIALQNDLEAQLKVEVTHLAAFDGRKTMKASHICPFIRALNVSGFKTNIELNDCRFCAAAGRLR
jgi:hypothetical protein